MLRTMSDLQWVFNKFLVIFSWNVIVKHKIQTDKQPIPYQALYSIHDIVLWFVVALFLHDRNIEYLQENILKAMLLLSLQIMDQNACLVKTVSQWAASWINCQHSSTDYRQKF